MTRKKAEPNLGNNPYAEQILAKRRAKRELRKQNRHIKREVTNFVAEKHADDMAFNKSEAFISSFKWRQLRMEAFKLYGRKCLCCGNFPPHTVLNVDHIKPRKHFPELALDINNLQVLCGECNHGKGNKVGGFYSFT